MLLPRASPVPRGLHSNTPKLAITLILIGALAVILSFTTLGFGLLSFSSIQYRKNRPDRAAPQVLPVVASVPAVAPSPIIHPEQDLGNIEERLREVNARAQQVDQNEQRAHTAIASLQQQELQLTQAIEQRQSALRDAQNDVTRAKDEQQRILALRAEAADLERRIAALRTSIDAAGPPANDGRASQPTTPQVIECVRGGIILRPQQTQITFSALRSGVLASLARERGVYFLVRPTGFESFIEARNIARSTGKVVGYEPIPSAEDR